MSITEGIEKLVFVAMPQLKLSGYFTIIACTCISIFSMRYKGNVQLKFALFPQLFCKSSGELVIIYVFEFVDFFLSCN